MSYKFKSKSILHKLYTRELNGGFKKKSTVSALELFDEIPEEHILNLGQVFENLGNHVFMGTTLCGKFLMTYSIKRTALRSDFGLPNLIYILHLWSFSRAPHQSRKVAEIHLFSGFSSEITTHLNITVSQWPTLPDKLIVYGETELNCPSSGDYHTSNTFLTITHLPSLASCPQCKHIADAFQRRVREPHAPSNNNRCFKHGATLDAMFLLAHPHPKLDIRVNIKCPNRFLVNTGNFLHILSMELHNKQVEPSKSAPTCLNNYHYLEENSKPIVSENREHKVIQGLCRNNPMFKFLHFEDGTRKKSTSNNFLANAKKDEQENLNIRKLVAAYSTVQEREKKEHKERGSSENMQHVKNIMAQADKIYTFEECEDGCELKFKWFRKRKLADKMYEFCSDEDELENSPFSNLLKELRYEYEHSSQPKSSKVSFGRFLKIRLNHQSKSQESSRWMQSFPCERQDGTVDRNEEPSAFLSRTDTVQSELFLKTDSFCSKPDNCDISSIISDWESQDTASLSPKSDISSLSDFSTSSMPGPSSGIRFSLKNKKPRQSLKKYTSTNVTGCSVDTTLHGERHAKATLQKSLCVILKPHNRLCYPTDDVKSPASNNSNRLDRRTPEPHQIHLISGCCNDLERYYVMDERFFYDSDIQVITESEVDCCEDGNQVPIVVRGPSRLYTSKLKLTSDLFEASQTEYCSVKQNTLDIEQFCFKAADLICKNENYNFRSCNDYDVEVVNVCPLNGDVIAAVSIRINAVAPPFKKYSLPDCSNRCSQFLSDLRKEFDTCCILIWNVNTLMCRVEAYTPLQPLRCKGNPTQWENQTYDIARTLRFQSLGYFNVPCLLPRCIDHKVKIEKGGEEIYNESITEIYDKDNLVGFRLDKKHLNQEDETDSEDDIDDILFL